MELHWINSEKISQYFWLLSSDSHILRKTIKLFKSLSYSVKKIPQKSKINKINSKLRSSTTCSGLCRIKGIKEKEKCWKWQKKLGREKRFSSQRKLIFYWKWLQEKCFTAFWWMFDYLVIKMLNKERFFSVLFIFAVFKGGGYAPNIFEIE